MATRLATFPESFCQRPHPIAQEIGCAAWQWQLLDDKGECLISVVGGAPVMYKGHLMPTLYGDGVTTFEMWDFKEPDPRPWLTKDEINAYLAERGITAPAFEDLDIKDIKPKEST